jgi:HD-GYP domain-containing protein (c-di-GMP phosphodiesterase class II)
LQGLIKAQTILSKFAEIEEHSRRVSILAGKLASILKYPEPKARSISIAGYMHDLGKTAWPQELHYKGWRLIAECNRRCLCYIQARLN